MVTYYINNTLKITKKCLFFIDIVLTRHNKILRKYL